MTINRSRDLGFGADPTADELTTWATIGSTTGSPTTGQFTYLGVVHNYWKWTASGSVTFSAAGRVKTLVVAGGGGSGSDSGGGAGGLIQTVLDAKATVYNVNVGGGGAGAGDTSARGASGTDSYFGGLVALGGGGGGSSIIIGAAGGSAGGSSRIGGTTSATTTYGPQGYGCTVSTGDGGGGAGGAGGTSGGVGVTWIDGVVYATGGDASISTATVANTGNGGNGVWASLKAGASGVVVIAIPVI